MSNLAHPKEWRRLRTSIGTAELVPEAVDRMLGAASTTEAQKAYWEIDNRVVVQGQLYDSAPLTARYLMEEICLHRYTADGLSCALDLLVELAYGESDYSEVERGNSNLGSLCRATIRERLECLNELADEDQLESVLMSILDLADRSIVDADSLRAFLNSLPVGKWSDSLRIRVQEIGVPT